MDTQTPTSPSPQVDPQPVQTSPERPPQAETQLPDDKSKSPLIYVLIGVLLLLIVVVGGYVVYNRFFASEPEVEDTVVDEDGDEDVDANSCEYDGTTYSDGDSFPATDGCNTCTCDEGFVGCTEMYCGDDG